MAATWTVTVPAVALVSMKRLYVHEVIGVVELNGNLHCPRQSIAVGVHRLPCHAIAGAVVSHELASV
jgi:hypothetical protein